MNQKFFSLPPERQQAITRAGFSVFSRASYKRSPMSEIADAAGISKSLLFHYFQNKRELYLYLWDTCARITREEMKREEKETLEKGKESGEGEDLFACLERSMRIKLGLLRRYPDLGLFALRAFYERDPAVSQDIQGRMEVLLQAFQGLNEVHLDPGDYRPGLDLEKMVREMVLASEGCLWERMQRGSLDPDEVEKDFRDLVDFWKSVYLREGREAKGTGQGEGKGGSHEGKDL